MNISLEHVDDSPVQNTLRVTFHSAEERCLLPYPSVSGLKFTRPTDDESPQWTTRYIISSPLDDFVMTPGARIAFDLHAHINADDQVHRWTIDLSPGNYDVYFDYRVDRETDWYDFLRKRSRFADMTPIWRGSVRSNTIPFQVIDPTRE